MTIPDVLPRTLEEVRAEFVRQAQTAAKLNPDEEHPYLTGEAQGWQTAIHLLDGLPPELCGEHALEVLADALNENRRRLLALTRATIQPQDRSGRVDALGDATDLAAAAADRAAEDSGEERRFTGALGTLKLDFQKAAAAASTSGNGEPEYVRGLVTGWGQVVELCDSAAALHHFNVQQRVQSLDFQIRELRARTRASQEHHPRDRQGQLAALDTALNRTREFSTLVNASATRPHSGRIRPHHPELAALLPGEARFEGDEDLSDWTGYPAVPMDDVVMQGPADLALFLGGDDSSFTGDLLRLINKADPENLNRIAAGFPRHVRAWVLFQACQPVPARTLVKLLEATAMMDRRMR